MKSTGFNKYIINGSKTLNAMTARCKHVYLDTFVYIYIAKRATTTSENKAFTVSLGEELFASVVFQPSWRSTIKELFADTNTYLRVCWLKAMRLTRSTIRISSLIFIAPPLSLVLIYFVLGETILPSTLLGLAFILAGLCLQSLKRGVR